MEPLDRFEQHNIEAKCGPTPEFALVEWKPVEPVDKCCQLVHQLRRLSSLWIRSLFDNRCDFFGYGRRKPQHFSGSRHQHQIIAH